MRKYSIRVLFLILSALVLAGCGGGGAGSGGSGTINVSMTDSASDDYKAVYVTVREIQVHRNGADWRVVSTPGKTYNLLELVNGVRETLAITSLEAGHYTQLRLLLGNVPDDGINLLSRRHPYANYFIDKDDSVIQLKVPSGFQTGIKIVKGFDIQSSRTTELILDFNVTKSIIQAGSSGQWLLNPTIKMLAVRECSSVSGTITAESDGKPIAGALVSAQVYDPDATDPAAGVIIEAATISGETGGYKLFLEPGVYLIVACKDEYKASYLEVVAESGKGYTCNLVLEAAEASTLTGTATITGADSEQYVAIQVLQGVAIGNTTAMIAIKEFNIANRQDYSVKLPVGLYAVSGSTYGLPGIVQEIQTSSAVAKTADFTF